MLLIEINNTIKLIDLSDEDLKWLHII